MFNFRFRLATGNVKKSTKFGHYHYQFHWFPIGSQTGSWTCDHNKVQNELYSLSNFGKYRITTLGKNDDFGVLGRKMVPMVLVSPFKGWIPGPIRCFQNIPRCLLHALTGFILIYSTLEKNYSCQFAKKPLFFSNFRPKSPVKFF